MLLLKESSCCLSKFAEVSKISFKFPTALFSRFSWLKLASWVFKEIRSSTSFANFLICTPKGYLKFLEISNSSVFRFFALKLAPVSGMGAFFRDKAPILSARSIFEKRCKTTDSFSNFNIYIYYILKKRFLARISKKF